MEPSWMESGAVYRWPHDERPMRVLMHDNDVAMYDAWWPHLDQWGLANVKEVRRKRVDYYVATLSVLAKKAAYVRTDPLTEDELRLHRPDLPFSTACCAEARWPRVVPDRPRELAEHLRSAGCLGDSGEVALNASELCLYPFGPNGGQKRGVRVTADDGIAFTIEEILWKAAAAQAQFVDDVPPVAGIGLYRAGLQRGIPSYYLWGSESRLRAPAQ